ncbi:MAG: hypothetical protein AB7T06_29385 [Kofleriaceae bacterium]
MTEQERIEGINSEQLATATDRVLLTARFGRARPSSTQLFARGTSGHALARGSSPQLPARGSTPRLHAHGLYAPQSDAPLYAPQTPARESSLEIHAGAISRDDLTVLTRQPRHARAAWRRFATTALVTSLLSVATAIALLV